MEWWERCDAVHRQGPGIAAPEPPYPSLGGQPCPPEQGIGDRLKRADDRPDPPPLDQPLPGARLPLTAGTTRQVVELTRTSIQKVRNGGQQAVVVQHVNVSGGGQAMVAGTVKMRTKKVRERSAKAEGQTLQ